ncbi:MAG TPA: ComEC/Rec2 family competence protein [Luteibaculaceae bacterium]|nr:ComEC/Rec2 family competence protein [Luteibaculaceae bacterium]
MWSLPAFKFFLAVVIATLLGLYYPPLAIAPKWYFEAVFVLLLAILAMGFDRVYLFRWVNGLLVLLLVAVLVIPVRLPVSFPEKRMAFSGVVIENLGVKKGKTRVVLKLIQPAVLHQQTFIWYSRNMADSASMGYGTVVKSVGFFKSDKHLNPQGFRQWIRQKGCVGVIQSGCHTVQVARSQGYLVYFDQIKVKLLATVKSRFNSASNYALFAAMFLGEREYLDPKDVHLFTVNGAMHILAVSGMHVGMLFFLLQFACNQIGLNQQPKVKTLISIVCIGYYALLCGFEPSVARSALMFSLLQMGSAIQKRSSSLNIVFFAAVIQIIYDPLIVYSVGFLLSYSAVLGILLINPILKKCWEPRTQVGKYLWEITTVGISAQLMTAPIVLHFFGQYPVYALLANLLLIPISTAQMVLGFTVLFSAVLGIDPKLLILIFEWVTAVLRLSMEWVCLMPYQQVFWSISSGWVALGIWSLFLVVFDLLRDLRHFPTALPFSLKKIQLPRLTVAWWK